MAIDVCLEVGSKRVFASALDWPGWCRAGRDEDIALETLAVYRARYEVVVREAGLELPDAAEFRPVERLAGDATTDFGAPGALAEHDRRRLTAPDAERLASLVAACWRVFDRIAEAAPAALRKGPRGGGRDTAQVVAHVIGAEAGYGRSINVRHKPPNPGDEAAVAALREAILTAIRAGDAADEGRWPLRYAARRVAWHALDHAWEIEDRSV